jgi:hypothetical protein
VVGAPGSPDPNAVYVFVNATTPDAFQVGYAANLNVADSVVNVTNNGASGGNLCVNVYTFDNNEEMLSCCSCPVTPNGLDSMQVNGSLLSSSLTGQHPPSAVIELLATAATAGTPCNAATVLTATPAPGLGAWGTTLHLAPTGYKVTENPFSFATLSVPELNHLASFCSFITPSGSNAGFGGAGVCPGCTSGGM